MRRSPTPISRSPTPNGSLAHSSTPNSVHSQKSTFGIQVLSNRPTGPFTLFGSAERVNADKLYLDRDLAKTVPGNNSPGPVYKFASSIGKQVESIAGNSPEYSIGQEKRWKSRRMGPPGPGAYDGKRTAFGNQIVSTMKSPEKADFGKSTREQTNAIEERVRYFSPGPFVCDDRSSLGQQIHSINHTAPEFRFGHEKRFRGVAMSLGGTPGAGCYECKSSVGKQQESRKCSSPSYSMGTSTRDRREKIYLSKDHDKSLYGGTSPGPAGNIRLRSSLGFQPNSRNASASAFKFGSEERFKSRLENHPGPGAYDC